jgi:uncharacterized damage-inducible protein DinB
MDTDPVLAAARQLVSESLKELRASVSGLPVEALNWHPGGRGTNSIAVLATHTMHSTHLWLTLAMGGALPERDRDSELRASAEDSDTLARLVDALSQDCLAVLQQAAEIDWDAMRETQGRGGDAPPAVPAAYALIHATEHLRGHVDQVALIRQLWENPPGK